MRTLLLFLCLVFIGLAIPMSNAFAQSDPILEEYLRSHNGLQDSFQDNTLRLEEPSRTVREPERGDTRAPAGDAVETQGAERDRPDVSDLEKAYSSRAGAVLRQVGYGNLRTPAMDYVGLRGAPVDSYILGVGDKIVVTLRGQENTTYRTEVDREGQVIIPGLPPVAAAGRTFGAFQDTLQDQVDESLLQTQAFVSLGAMRQMSVLVSGEVYQPGVRTVTGQSTILDALAAAGGIKKTGSLRKVTLVRGGRARTIDLYDILVEASTASDLRLREGDRVIVPLLGMTVAVTGDVVRSGIYELRGDSLSAAEVLRMAGGTVQGVGYQIQRVSSGADGRDVVSKVQNARAVVLAKGDILVIRPSAKGQSGYVGVQGHVTVSGRRALTSVPRLSSLLADSGNLGDEPYLPFVVIRTHDPVSMAPRWVAVDGVRTVLGQTDYTFRDRDEVVILSMTDVAYLSSADVQRVLAGEGPLYGLRAVEVGANSAFTARHIQKDYGQEALVGYQDSKFGQEPGAGQRSADSSVNPMQVCQGLKRLAAVVSRRGLEQGVVHLISEPAAGALPPVFGCPEVYDDYPGLLAFVLEHSATISGEVREPGIYPVAGSMRLSDLVRASGGLTPEASRDELEIHRWKTKDESAVEDIPVDIAMREAVLGTGDMVRVNPVFSEAAGGTVLLAGEVRHPGLYAIHRGESLSSVIIRAGGLTNEAYPEGSVFSRDSVRKAEEKNYELMARELRAGLTQAVARNTAENKEADQSLVAMVERLTQTLEHTKAVGRVAVEADPAVLQVRPELDTVLMPKDRLYVPGRPTHVAVAGEVLNIGAFQHRAGLSANDYIDMAGGMRSTADEDRIFVVLPSGEARPLQASFWNYQEQRIPPGSTVVVPPDLSPFSFWTAVRDLTGIMSQVAISAASLAVIND